MIKKFLIILTLFLFSNCFAISKDELNFEFFNGFNDENLVYYINEAFLNNHNVKQVVKQVEQYREQIKYSFSKELPSLSVSANYLGIKIPELDNFSLRKNAFILPFAVNYEADFLLKNRDKTKAAKKTYEAVLKHEQSAYISLLTDVAVLYSNILHYDELINLTEEKLYLKTKLKDHALKKYEFGTIDNTFLNNIEKEIEITKNELYGCLKQQEVLLMQMATLTGQSTDNYKTLKRSKLETFDYTKTIPDTIKSDVIFSRPDVKEAEFMLQKAKIDIRIARKEFLPTFNIMGIWVFNTIAPGTFFSWESSLAAILAGATQDIFTGGRKIANLKIQKSKYEELFENYRQIDLDALREVNSALCFIKYDTKIDNNNKNKLSFITKNTINAKNKFLKGTISEPDLINSKLELIEYKKENAQSKTQRIIDYFTLYKATGGKL